MEEKSPGQILREARVRRHMERTDETKSPSKTFARFINLNELIFDAVLAIIGLVVYLLIVPAS